MKGHSHVSLTLAVQHADACLVELFLFGFNSSEKQYMAGYPEVRNKCQSASSRHGRQQQNLLMVHPQDQAQFTKMPTTACLMVQHHASMNVEGVTADTPVIVILAPCRMFLCGRSEYFATMLTSGFLEAQEAGKGLLQLSLEDTSPQVRLQAKALETCSVCNFRGCYMVFSTAC